MAKRAHPKRNPLQGSKAPASVPDREGPKARGWWPRIRLAVLAAIVAILCGWLTVEMIRAYRQRSVVRAIWGLGGYVCRLHERPRGESLTPRWYQKVFGQDFMNPVVAVRLAATDTDDENLIDIGTLTHLLVLDLRDTRISDRGLRHLRRTTRLKVLVLTGTDVSEKGLVELRHMPQLMVLCLEETNVTDEGLQHLKGLTSLRWLDLGATRITDSSLKYLEECPSLEVLILDRCATSPEGLAELQRALPQTYVWNGGSRHPSIRRFTDSLGGE